MCVLKLSFMLLVSSLFLLLILNFSISAFNSAVDLIIPFSDISLFKGKGMGGKAGGGSLSDI